MRAKGLTCSESGCDREAIAHGICRMHYSRVYQRLRNKTYRSWDSMKQRCLNANFSSYQHYGGRGITICRRWLGEAGFQNFLADMGEVPEGLTLERIDNNKNYCPENCKWSTWKTQARNRRSSAMLTFNGKTQCIAAWADEVGIAYKTLYSRVRQGWSIAEMLNTPLRQQ